MLNIAKRIDVINALLQEATAPSLTYAALECRLTLEYLCYERFKLFYSYLSSDDLKNWQPKHVVKQISEDIDENINKGFTLSISRQPLTKPVSTKDEYEALEYALIGQQAALNLNKLHSLWHGLANVALHIPVPSISSSELRIYGELGEIKKKVVATIEYLSGLNGNLLMGGPLGIVFSFNCHSCDTQIKKPVKHLKEPSFVSCINPECNESYLLEPKESGQAIEVTRRIIKFDCKSCGTGIEVPTKVFRDLRFEQQLGIQCHKCAASLIVVMRPLMKEDVD